jgi:hypothetical protein
MYFFCSEKCRAKFAADPLKYFVAEAAPAPAPTQSAPVYVCPMHPEIRRSCGIGSSGLLGRPASEYGSLCHGRGAHEGGDRRGSVLMLPTLQVLHDRRVGLAERAAGDPGTANTA